MTIDSNGLPELKIILPMPTVKEPAAQHQGEPVGEIVSARDIGFRVQWRGGIWPEDLPVGTKLYTHPDAGEVERLTRKCQNADLALRVQTQNCERLRAQLAGRDALLADAANLAMFTLPEDWHARYAALSASAEPTTAKQETHDEMRIRHKREFDALDGSGFHYQECRCGTRGSYPVEVKHCVCGKPFDSAKPSAPVERDEPQPVPLAWMRFDDEQRAIFTRSKRTKDSEPLYAHPTAYRQARADLERKP